MPRFGSQFQGGYSPSACRLCAIHPSLTRHELLSQYCSLHIQLRDCMVQQHRYGALRGGPFKEHISRDAYEVVAPKHVHKFKSFIHKSSMRCRSVFRMVSE